jgi:hypothetical protein
MSEQPTHKQLVKDIQNLIESHGGFIYKHYSGSPIGMNGISDLIGCYKGRAILILGNSFSGLDILGA